MVSVRYYEIRRTESAADDRLGPFAAPSLDEAVMRADRWAGPTSALRWASWELLDFDTHDVVAHGSSDRSGRWRSHQPVHAPQDGTGAGAPPG